MKKDFYDVNDAGKTFFWAVVTPQILGTLIYVIFLWIASYSGTTVEELLNQTIPTYIMLMMSQIAFAIVFFTYNRKIDFMKACKINKLSTRNIFICIAIAIIVVMGISPISNILVELMKQAGLQVSTTLPIGLNTIWDLLLAILLVALVPAIFEELIFRGAVLQGLRKFGTWIAVLGSALLFALMHASAVQFVYTFLFGIILALVVIKSGSIISSMICHFTGNALSLIFSYVHFEDETIGASDSFYCFLAFLMVILVSMILFSLLKQMKNNDRALINKYAVNIKELNEIKDLANSDIVENTNSQNGEQEENPIALQETQIDKNLEKELLSKLNDVNNSEFKPNNNTSYLTYGFIISLVIWGLSFAMLFV